MIEQVYDSQKFAKNRDGLYGTLEDMKAEGITSLSCNEVKRIAEEFRLNYSSGKIACKRLGIKIK